MRALFVCSLAVSIVVFGMSHAAVEAIPGEAVVGDAGPAPAGETAPQTLDSLFADLSREASAPRAELIAGRIQAHWLRTGSATVDLLMGWAAEAVANGNNGAAFDLFEQAMILAPDEAEPWNGRATLNYQLGHYGRAIADVEQTLQREPRHFGALMGLATMMEEAGREVEALRAYRRVLEVYPALPLAQDAVARLASKTRGQSL